jgi:hypothetical protein
VTPRDSRESQPARRRQKKESVPVIRATKPEPRDRNLSQGDRVERPTRQANESRYGGAFADPRVLKIRVELVIVRGPAAVELIKRQASAVREVLQWIADHPSEMT